MFSNDIKQINKFLLNVSKRNANREGLYLYNEYVLMILVILFWSRDF